MKDKVLVWSVWLTAVFLFIFSGFILETQRMAIKETLELLNSRQIKIEQEIKAIQGYLTYCNQIKKQIKK